MRHLLLLFFFIGLFNAFTFGQSITKLFEIEPAKMKVQNSLYNRIAFLDSREDSILIGIVDIGPLKNHDANFILKTPVEPQLTKLLNSLTDSSAKDGKLLFQLRDFRFVEKTGTRYCYLNAELYTKKENQYQKISFLDTVMIVKGPDASRTLTKEGNTILSDFIAKSLTLEPKEGFTYTFGDLKVMESIEKRRIPVYNTSTFNDGIYDDYNAFKNQVPDRQGIVQFGKDGSINSVKVLDSGGKKLKIKSKNIYAVIWKGRPFIATEYGYYPLEKINDNLFFTGDIKIASSAADIATAQVGFGLIGAALASSGSQKKYDLIIDHLNGKFIHLISISVDTDQ